MTATARRSSLLAVFAMTAALAALAIALSAQPAQSAVYHTCGLSEAQQQPSNDKPSYNLSLKQKSTSCTTAKKVMKSYHSCRSKLGIACTHKIRTHWSCNATKSSSSALAFYATATCAWGSRRVRVQYQQNK